MKIHYHQEFDRQIVKVIFLEEAQYRGVYNFATKKGFTLAPGEEIPSEAVLEIPSNVWKDMLKGFAEIANEEGLKLESDLKREGKLEATERHLSDLRTLLKLPKSNPKKN